MRKAKWVLIGGAIFIVVMFIFATRSSSLDDLAALKPYVSSDGTVYSSARPGSHRRAESWRILELDNISSDQATVILKQIAAKRKWPGEPYPRHAIYSASAPTSSGEPDELWLSWSSRIDGRGFQVFDVRHLTFWDVLMVRLKHFGHNPFKNFGT